MNYINIFAGADTHCGHDVGLTPPEHNWKPPEKASSKEHQDYQFRTAAWNWFENEVKKTGPFDHAIWNGDLVDGTGIKSSGTEDLEIPTQVDIAADIVRFVGAIENHFIRGTRYHVGDGKRTWEDMVLGVLGIPGNDVHGMGQYWIPEKGGLMINVRHKIGNSSSPISQFTALSGARIRQLLWAETEQQEKANLILRAHIHRCQCISEPERNRAAWTMPALQGLGSVYAREVDGLPVHFGFLVIKVKDKNDWGVEAHIAPMTMQKASAAILKKKIKDN